MKESWYLHEGRCEGQLWCFAGLCSARTLCAIAVLGEKHILDFFWTQRQLAAHH